MTAHGYQDQGTAPKRGGGFLASLRSLLVIALGAWLLRSLVIAPFSIPSGSMLPQLYIGDYLFAAKWPYGYSRDSFPWGVPSFSGRIFSRLPERGDVVVFRHPHQDIDLIKRVIGLPGDTVAMNGGTLVLNGRPLPRESVAPFALPVSPNSPCRVVPGATPKIISDGTGEQACLYPAFREKLPGGRSYLVFDQVDNPQVDDFGPFRVPAGTVFLMGDNRDDSLDSRFPAELGGIGAVPMERLIGRATILFWSTDGGAEWVQPWTWFTALRTERLGKFLGGDGE